MTAPVDFELRLVGPDDAAQRPGRLDRQQALGWVAGMLANLELPGDWRIEVAALHGAGPVRDPYVTLPLLNVTEARLIARMLELAPVEASLSRGTLPDSIAAELVRTAASLRTAFLEAITAAQRGRPA